MRTHHRNAAVASLHRGAHSGGSMLVSVTAPAPKEARYPFADTPLVVAFAATERLTAPRTGSAMQLAVTPEVSPDDAYLVLPARAYGALEAAFALGQAGRLAQWFSEALVVLGDVETTARGPRLRVAASWSADEAIESASPRAISLGTGFDPVRVANQLDPLAQIAPVGLFDREGVRLLTSGRDYAGLSRADCDLAPGTAALLPPTFVWSTASDDGASLVRVVLATDDDTCLALLAPIAFVP